ncbi:MAG: hypothetical protein WC756_03455 [Taibaiella sp.]|jgi:hypothetical protein
MKRNKIIAVTAGAFICMAAIITSCSKDKTVTQSNPSEPGKTQQTTMASTVDLQNYPTRFVKNADGTQSIFFAEPEDIVVYVERAQKLGYNALTLAKGVYEIKVDKRGHSTLDLNILTADGVGSETAVPMGIRIAKRHKMKCGTTYLGADDECKCGIGFNCGFVSHESATDQSALMSTGNNGNIHLDFQQNNMNWVAIEN